MDSYQVLLLLLTSAILAFAVWRSRRLVLRQMVAESAHANLARYFSPDIVDELAAGSYAIYQSRAENVGVLFADGRGSHRVDRGTWRPGGQSLSCAVSTPACRTPCSVLVAPSTIISVTR